MPQDYFPILEVIKRKVYDEWAKEYEEAELSKDEDAIREASDKIEWDLELLGVTGIEDKLQDGVPECISSLRRAGIKVWVLTGDKVETAVNIAFSCRLFTVRTELVHLSASSEVGLLVFNVSCSHTVEARV